LAQFWINTAQDGKIFSDYTGLDPIEGRRVMAKFLVVHGYSPSYKGKPEDVLNTDEFAVGNASGAWPAKCLFSWIPQRHARKDTFAWCLWEAKTIEDLKAALDPFAELITSDITLIDEYEWAKYTAKIPAYR
jgi:hypothetical protein